MVELDFPTNIIRLTKATLTAVKCCVKIQNDPCSDPFDVVKFCTTVMDDTVKSIV
jgi:hypothetical protein